MIGILFAKFKFYLGAALAILAAGAALWIKMLRSQRDAARLEAELQKHNGRVQERARTIQQGLAAAVQKAQGKAAEVDNGNQLRRAGGTRPTGDFGDERLRGGDNKD